MNKLAIQSLPSSANDAIRLASRLGVPMHEIEMHEFPDGELRVAVGPAARTTILYFRLDRPNDKLLAVLFAAEALRRNGATRLVLLAPYLCYMRQDAAFRQGEAISQKVIGVLLAGVVDRVITVNAHLHRTGDIRDVFPGIAAEDLSAMPAIVASLREAQLEPGTVVVGPDVESLPWVEGLASQLGLACAVGAKVRRNDRSVEIEFSDSSMLAGRPILLIDDTVLSGGTLIACAKALASIGALSIDVIVAHALFRPSAMRQFTDAGIRSVRSTHSVPHPTNAIPLDDIFVGALREEFGAPGNPENPR